MNVETDKVQKFGNVLVDMFHFLALFIIGATVVWSAGLTNTQGWCPINSDRYPLVKRILDFRILFSTFNIIFLKRDFVMKKVNKTISVFTFIFLFVSFLFAPVNLVLADDAASEKTTSDSDKDPDKKKKEKGKGKDKGKAEGKGKGEGEEEPECE